MNLMSQLKSSNTEKIKKILDKQKAFNIQTVDLKDYTVKFSESYYFLDSVPLIPDDYEVTSKWSNCLPIKVNWNKEKNIDFDQMKKQYGFVATIESKEVDKRTKRKKVIYCNMIFNNLATCVKHLEWFNSCFPETVKTETPPAKPLYKTKKKNKK